MPKKLLKVIVVLGVLVGALSLLFTLFPVLACWRFISPEKAMQAVRAFEGDSSLQFKNVELRQDPPSKTNLVSCVYRMQHSSYPIISHIWTVNAYTAEVQSVIYGTGSPDYSDTPGTSYSQSCCLKAAQAFATAKYNDFAKMSFQICDQTWTGYAWRFVWRQQVAYQAWTPNTVAIEVDSNTGQVATYSSVRIPTPTPHTPILTASQAVAAAKQATGIVTVTKQEGPMLESDPNGNTAWSMLIAGEDAQSNSLQYVVVVNATTGAIIENIAPSAFNQITDKKTNQYQLTKRQSVNLRTTTKRKKSEVHINKKLKYK